MLEKRCVPRIRNGGISVGCGKVKPLAEFYALAGGRRSYTLCKACHREWRRKDYALNFVRDRERQAQYSREWYIRNKERYLKEILPDYFRSAKGKKTQGRGIARRKQASGGSFYSQRNQRLYLERACLYDYLCFYCHKKPYAAFEHLIPLCRGGGNWPANIVPACRSCNGEKGSLKYWTEWRFDTGKLVDLPVRRYGQRRSEKIARGFLLPITRPEGT